MNVRDLCPLPSLPASMTVILRLLPVITGAITLLPLAVPGTVPLSLTHLAKHVKSEQHNSLESSIRSNEIDTREVLPPTQQGNTATLGHLPPFYLERIKERILSKMQLSEEPRFNQPLENLPDVIRERFSELISPQQPPSTQAPPTLERASILLASARKSCRGQRGALCLHFKLEDAMEQDVASATLWFWKARGQSVDSNNFIVKEVLSRGRTNLLSNETMSETVDGWVKVDLSAAAERWAREERQEVGLKVWCSTCGHHTLRSKETDHIPFIVVAATETNTHKRRRAVERECSGENESRCCREAIHINVTEMGWDDWFIHPKTFTFYYCHGSCPAAPVTGRTHTGSEYNKIKQALMLREESLAPKDELEPCCSPTSYFTMSILHASRDGLIKVRHVPDLQVRSCGCRD